MDSNDDHTGILRQSYKHATEKLWETTLITMDRTGNIVKSKMDPEVRESYGDLVDQCSRIQYRKIIERSIVKRLVVHRFLTDSSYCFDKR
jgi:hypothetical protein